MDGRSLQKKKENGEKGNKTRKTWNGIMEELIGILVNVNY